MARRSICQDVPRAKLMDCLKNYYRDRNFLEPVEAGSDEVIPWLIRPSKTLPGRLVMEVYDTRTPFLEKQRFLFSYDEKDDEWRYKGIDNPGIANDEFATIEEAIKDILDEVRRPLQLSKLSKKFEEEIGPAGYSLKTKGTVFMPDVWAWCQDAWPEEAPYSPQLSEQKGYCSIENQNIFSQDLQQALNRAFREKKMQYRGNAQVSPRLFSVGDQAYTVDYVGENSKGERVFVQRAIDPETGLGEGRWRLLKRISLKNAYSKPNLKDAERQVLDELQQRKNIAEEIIKHLGQQL